MSFNVGWMTCTLFLMTCLLSFGLFHVVLCWARRKHILPGIEVAISKQEYVRAQGIWAMWTARDGWSWQCHQRCWALTYFMDTASYNATTHA